MPPDMLGRLGLDPGTRTLGELMQEREWAAWEIRRLRSDVDRLSRKHHATRIEGSMEHAEGFDRALSAQRLLRLSEVSSMIGLCRSSIYQYVSEGQFPPPVKVGYRSVRWKLVDVLAWRAHISEVGAGSEGKKSGASPPRRLRDRHVRNTTAQNEKPSKHS